MSNFQHAGDWRKIHGVVKGPLTPLINENYSGGYAASVGYITADPMPSIVKKVDNTKKTA
jgi:hypothetical protein